MLQVMRQEMVDKVQVIERRIQVCTTEMLQVLVGLLSLNGLRALRDLSGKLFYDFDRETTCATRQL